MPEIKTGDPKVRAFVQDAVDDIDRYLESARGFHFDESDPEVRLHVATRVILTDFQAGVTPYHLSHVIGLAEAVLGVRIND